MTMACAPLAGGSWPSSFLRCCPKRDFPPPPHRRAFLCRCFSSGSDVSHVNSGKLDVAQVEDRFSIVSAEDQLSSQDLITGGAFDFKGATISLTNNILTSPKKVTLVRHGLSSWNEENRVQGSVCTSISMDALRKSGNPLLQVPMDEDILGARMCYALNRRTRRVSCKSLTVCRDFSFELESDDHDGTRGTPLGCKGVYNEELRQWDYWSPRQVLLRRISACDLMRTIKNGSNNLRSII